MPEKYYNLHRQERLAYQSDYYRQNRAKILERQREYFRMYYQMRKEKINTKNRIYSAYYYEQSKKNKPPVTIERDILVKFTF